MCDQCDKSFDNTGRPWARVADVKKGSVLIADDGFVWDKDENDKWIYCIKEGAELVVKRDRRHQLYVDCANGKHYLDGQYEEQDGVEFYIGFYLKEQ